jgi:hypothetical protein
LVATKALETVSMLPKALAGDPAMMAGHGLFLESIAQLPENEFAGSSRLRLWWILAPVSVSNADQGFVLTGNLMLAAQACQ